MCKLEKILPSDLQNSFIKLFISDDEHCVLGTQYMVIEYMLLIYLVTTKLIDYMCYR